ncbi:MAG TPA: S53 family peptidase, partial [Acidimicrobiales bacterium]|nr:S53 family peptidase [Acidimicrobiales bacterium]
MATVAAGALTVGLPSLAAAATRPPATIKATVKATIKATIKATATTTVREGRAAVGHSPRLPADAARVGAVPAGRTVNGVIGLKPQHAAALADFAKAISTPGTPEYHHYLAAGRFESTFSPSPATVNAVEQTLRSEGLSVSSLSSNRLLIGFRGTTAAVDSAFHTSLDSYRLRDGRTVFANTSAPTLPASIAPSVEAVIGLNDLTEPQATPFQPATKPRGTPTQRAAATKAAASAPTTAGGPVACKTAVRTAGGLLGLTDTQLADIYGVNGLYKAGDRGQGQTVAVYELEPYRTVDISHFDSCYFGAAATTQMLSRLKTVNVDGGNPVGPGSAESELDIDDVSALAPGANIRVYEAPPTDAGYLDDWNAIVSDDTAKTVTSSWGSGCETEIAAAEPGLMQVENEIFEQAAIQGQTVLDAAGDAGSDGCAYDSYTPVAPTLSVDDPASQPYVTAVGGTTVNQPTDPPKEQAWNDGATGGAGGGGISAVWPQPAWQRYSTEPGMDAPTVISQAESVSGGHFCQSATVTTPCRELPDVSANADEDTGVTIEYAGEWGTIGGTSSSTPLWAAMLADIDSTPACRSAGGVGFASPALYAVASVPAEYRASFNDITTSNIDQFGAAKGLYPATKGYDMATGLGSPRVTGPAGSHGLAYYLCTPAASAPPVVSQVTPPVVSSSAG